MKIRTVLLSLGLLAFSACAMPPSATKLDKLPVIEFGRVTPDKGDFILYFPAGRDIPTEVAIEGNLFQQPAQQVLTVKLKRDIYSYKDWMSYDKQNWVYAQDELGMRLDIKIPGYTHPRPGHIRLNLSEKQ